MPTSGGTVSAQGQEQKKKRPHTEVADSSIGDEMISIQRQLDQMSSDIQSTRDDIQSTRYDLKNLMSKTEMREFITKTVEKITMSMKAELDKHFAAKVETTVIKRVDEKLDEKIDDKMGAMSDRIDTLTLENVNLREEIDKLKTQITENGNIAKAAMQRAHMNEQYSRKNNIKIMGVPEDGDEPEDRLIHNVQQILQQMAGVVLEAGKIMVIHRIPGKSGLPKPVLLKLTNNNEKAKIMRKRKEMKNGGYRLVDDVTKDNTKLINKLNEHKDIDSAWYFNGSVYGKSKTGVRSRFDLYTDIDDVITGWKTVIAGGSTATAAEPMDSTVSK